MINISIHIMKNLLIVAHAPSPNTLALFQALTRGAKSIDNIQVIHQTPFETQPNDIINADAVILLTPENLGYISGALKDFFDRCYYPVLELKQGLPVAIVIRAGHDGTGACNALKPILTGLKWREIQHPVILKGDWKTSFIDQCEELGTAMAAGLEAGII